MEIDKFLAIGVQASAFISAFAGIAAGLLMAKVTKKFGTGILASGFKSIAIGVFLIAFGIVLDAIQVYFQISTSIGTIIIILRGILFVVGTYIIVIASKNTNDKLETLTK